MGKTSASAKDPAELIVQAEEFLREGQSDDALDAVDKAIAMAPHAPQARRTKATLLAQLDRFEEAVEVLDTAVEEIGPDPALLSEQGKLHQAAGNFARAAEAFERYITVDPQNSDAWLGKGRNLLDDGKADLALDCADRAIALNETLVEAHALRGDCLLALARWDEAFAAFAGAAKHAPLQFDASAWAARGDRFFEQQQLDCALKSYEEAIDQDPRNSMAWYGKGYALKERGDIEGAIKALVRASEANEWFTSGFLNAGVLYFEQGNLNGALDLFNRAKNAAPDEPLPWTNIAAVHIRAGRHDEALDALRHAAIVAPAQDAETWEVINSDLLYLGRLDEALGIYQRASEANEKNAWPHANRAWVYARQRRWDEAIQAIERAVDLEPNEGEFLVNRLFLLSERDQIDDADVDTLANAALEKIGADTKLRPFVAHFLADSGHLARARDLMHGVEPPAAEDEEQRVLRAEFLLKIGETNAAVDLIESIDLRQLGAEKLITWSFLRLVAERLAGAPQLSENLLVDFLVKLKERADRIDMISDWSLKGVRRLLARSELPVRDKLVLLTLADVQEANVRYNDLSFFTEMLSSSDGLLGSVPQERASG
jgi:tetratricopeptide (TPR) repeat protein